MTGREITDLDYRLIRENYTYLEDDELAILLDRTINSVRNIRRYLKLTRSKFNNPYSRYDIQFIKDNYKLMSDEEIAKALNRTAFAICHKRSKLKLKRNGKIDKHVLNKVYRMKQLIKICENPNVSLYMLETSKEKLKKLSGL